MKPCRPSPVADLNLHARDAQKIQRMKLDLFPINEDGTSDRKYVLSSIDRIDTKTNNWVLIIV